MNNSYLDYDYPSNEARPVNNSKPNGSNHSVSASSGHLINSFSTAGYSNVKFANKQPFLNPAINLNTVVPLSKTSVTNANGCYYDLPKNIPVNPRFANQSSMPLPGLVTSKFPVNELLNRPQLPQKSPVIINKISSYPSSPNYSNASLSKQNTSKPLPLLPSEVKAKRNSQNYDTPTRYNLVGTAAKFAYTNIYNEQDDEEEDCDYDYDYVCLESKKKLDNEDESVKKDISKDLQLKYERLVLNSSGLIDLQNLEKSMQNKSSLNPKVKVQILQSYSRLLLVAQKNFENWTKLNMEIIERNHPPSVYINFTKHILLSGQNLLLVAKSLNRHYDQIENLTHFADQFYDYLRQIVVKTKKSASEQSNIKSREEMAKSIKDALQFTNNLNIDFSKYCQMQ